MKRFIALLAIVICLLAFVGCSTGNLAANTTVLMTKATASSASSVGIVFVDSEVEATIRQMLSKAEDESILQSELLGMTEFSLSGTPFPPQQILLDDLRYMDNLEQLYLHDLDIIDLTPLSALTRLRDLSMSECNLTDIKPLSSLALLEELSLSNNMNLTDISPLASLKDLRDLSLLYTSVKDISALASMVNLEKLTTAFTPIQDFTALTGLNKLKYLACSCSAKDLPVLVKLKSLDTLRLFDSDITAEAFLQLQAALPDTKVSTDRPLE